MPALHPTYPCPACKKIHALYLAVGETPETWISSPTFSCPVENVLPSVSLWPMVGGRRM